MRRRQRCGGSGGVEKAAWRRRRCGGGGGTEAARRRRGCGLKQLLREEIKSWAEYAGCPDKCTCALRDLKFGSDMERDSSVCLEAMVEKLREARCSRSL